MYGKQPLRRFGVSTTRIAAVAILVLTVGMLSEPILAQGTANGMDFQIVDSATGIGVGPAEIKWGRIGQTSVAPLSQSAVSSSEGKLLLQLPPGEYALEIAVPGYNPMRTYDSVASGSVVSDNINLDPVVPAEEFRDSAVNPELGEGMELDHGFVSDALTHRPIAHVELKLEQSGAAATTNSRGYFQMMAPAQDTSKLRSAEEYPPLDTLTALAPGYKTYVMTGILHVPKGWSRFRIDLTPGTGITREDETPVPLMPAGSQPKNQASPSGHRSSPIPRFLLEWLAGHDTPVAPEEQQSAPTTTPLTNAITLPPNILVGSNCSNGKYGCTINASGSRAPRP
jgi:hypothetical protein